MTSRFFSFFFVMLLSVFHSASGGAAVLDYEDLGKPAQEQKPQFSLEGIEDPALLLTIREYFVAFSRNDFEKARDLSLGMTESAPEIAQGWHFLGVALANLDQREEAIAALEKAAELYKVNADPLVMIGDLHASLGRAAEARAAYERAVARDPGDWRAQDSLAGFEIATGDTASAEARLRTALANAPADYLPMRLKLASILLERDEAAPAQALIDDYVAANPANADGHTARARIALLAGRGDIATESLRKVVELSPDQLDPRIALARAEVSAGRFDLAEATLREAKTRFPANTALLFELGNVLAAQRNYEAAIAEYQEGLAADPADPRLLKAQSLAHYRLGAFDAAADLARTLAEREDAGSGDHAWLASVEEARGNADAARAAYETAIAADGRNWLAMNNLSALLAETDPARAVTLAEQAVTLAPDVAAVKDTLGWALFQAGRLDEAEATLRPLTEAANAAPTTVYRLGRVLLARDRVDEGRSFLLKALEMDAGFAYAEDARARLAE